MKGFLRNLHACYVVFHILLCFVGIKGRQEGTNKIYCISSSFVIRCTFVLLSPCLLYIISGIKCVQFFCGMSKFY